MNPLTLIAPNQAGYAKRDMVILPNDYLGANAAADEIFTILAKTETLFIRDRQIVEVRNDGTPSIEPLDASEFRSRLDRDDRGVWAWKFGTPKLVLTPKSCSRDTAILLMKTLSAREKLPHIQMVSSSAIVTEVDGEMRVLGKGYHDTLGGVYITSNRTIPDVDTATAVKALRGVLQDFRFQSKGDLSRAIAAIITPALRMGGLITDAVPIELVEADQSQTGKTYLQKLIRAIYGEKAYMVAQKKGGVGSLDESLSAGLLSGRPFVVLENLRGTIISEYLEAMVTWGESFPVRVPHKGEVMVSAGHVTVQITSNSMNTTPDMANRSSIVRVRKQVRNYPFKQYAEGDILAHITANQSYYMGCVAAVIKEWHKQGKQTTMESRHSFRQWARTLDWFVDCLFDGASLMDDHAEAHERIGDPKVSWLRNVALLVEKNGKLGQELIAAELFELTDMAGIEFPNQRRAYDETAGRNAVGRIMGSIFESSNVKDVAHLTVTRTEIDVYDDKSRKTRGQKQYKFDEN